MRPAEQAASPDSEIPTTAGLKCGRGVYPSAEFHSRGAMLPIEKNARTLVRVLAQHFPAAGGTSEDLRQAFVKDTSLVAPQSFYNALKHAKKQGWFVGGGRGQPYTLAPDGSWREPVPSSRETLEKEALDKDRLEYLVDSQTQHIQGLQSEIEQLRDWSSSSDINGANTALTSLLRIVGDSAASIRQRIRASAAVLGYKTQGDIADFVKKYLTSLCEDTDIAYDYRIEASELLRKHEAPRVVSETIKPTYREAEPTEPPEPLKDLVARRRERSERMQAEMIREFGWRDNSSGGNRSDESSD